MDEEICPVCQGKVIFYTNTLGYQIHKCQNCGLGVTKDLKTQIGGYHRDETYIEEESLFKNIFLKRINIINKFKKPGKTLEAGCSTGLMLTLLKNRGWQVLGVEISSKAAAAAKSRGIKVIVNNFMKVKIDDEFDLVILNHTLEHLENPLEVIKKVNSLLSPGGVLFIDVPNFGGLTAKLMKSSWPLLLPNEHLWHFSLKPLQILLQKQGFKTIFVERASGIWDYGNPLGGIILSFVTFKKRFFYEVVTALPSWLISKLGLGSDLMIIAKKKD